MLKIKSDQVEQIISEVSDSIIVPRYQNLKAHEIHFKGEDNPYTIADVEAEAELKKRLMDLIPGSHVVAEEEYDKDPSVLKYFDKDEPVWTIDPVDGTKIYIAGEPYYGVIISLNQKNETIAGWLYDPTSKQFITAEKGAGAYHGEQKLSVLPEVSIGEMSGIIGYRIICDMKKNCTPENPCPNVLKMRSSCHDFARLVAPKGHFSGELSQVHFHTWKETCTPWDSSAGILINAESGGYTAHWGHKPFAPSHYGMGTLTAPSKESWDEVCAWIKSFCAICD